MSTDEQIKSCREKRLDRLIFYLELAQRNAEAIVSTETKHFDLDQETIEQETEILIDFVRVILKRIQ